MVPKVQATNAKWCLFKNDKNQWCITGKEEWTLGVKQEYDYNQDADIITGVPANYHQTLDFYSKQSASWTNLFSLDRLFQQSQTLSISEFSTALRFEVFYWIDNFAFCLNLMYYIESFTVSLVTNNQVVECSSVLIDQLNEFTIYTDIDAKFIDTCSLSSGTDVTVYSLTPYEVIERFDQYLLGKDSYEANFCWPGPSPFNEPFEQYPDNFFYAIWKMLKDLKLQAPFMSKMVGRLVGSLLSKDSEMEQSGSSDTVWHEVRRSE